jgi:transcriptional regulator with XRE-family HTH domain
MDKIKFDWRTLNDNPVKQLRQALGMSSQAFASAVGIPRTTIYFTENGAIANISDNIHSYFYRRIIGYNRDYINQKYYDWIKLSRQEVKEQHILPPVATVLDKIPSDSHPTEFYIKHYDFSIAGFSTTVKVPKNVIYHYIKPGKVRSMPNSLRIALTECGMPYKEVQALDKAGAEYYDAKLNERIEERREFSGGRGKIN